VLACALTAFAAPTYGASGTRFTVPRGMVVDGWSKLGEGLDHVTFRRKAARYQAVNVARIGADAPFALRGVVSGQTIGGRLETTSSMCRRLKCAAAVNGDFFVYKSGQPVGGLTILGQALRSPNRSHPQLFIDGDRLFAGTDAWLGAIKLADGRPVTLDGVNVGLRGGKVQLFTAAMGKTTGNAPDTTEIRIQIVSPKGPLRLAQPTRIRFLDIRHIGNAPIPPDGAVLAGNGTGGAALDDLWFQMDTGHLRKDATVTVNSWTGATESIGGSHLLLSDGKRAFAINSRALVNGRHPRTIVGWNRQGEVFLVTADGRQPGYAEGLTLFEAASMMQQMGATDAINLDGGGSTTFVSRGRVVNRPSDARERSVATALVVVPVAKRPPSSAAKPKPPAASKPKPVPRTAEDRAEGIPVASSSLPGLPPDRSGAIAMAVALWVLTFCGVGSWLQVRRSARA
ncbi:MAG: phosphodiester glycosidase family protein, partial [Actinomycetota bacterium]